MAGQRQESTMHAAASLLRTMVIAEEKGKFIGGETELQKALGVSRATLRQVARLLEREGLLTVKRGINGGYFASKPDTQTVESAVTAYLEILDVRIDELMSLAAVTWEEALRQAASRPGQEAIGLAKKLSRLVKKVPADSPYKDVLVVEKQFRKLVFDLIDSPYMAFIFQVNLKFVERKFEKFVSHADVIRRDPELLSRWRSIKFLEVESVMTGDRDLAALAAQKSRRYWDSVTLEFPAGGSGPVAGA